jgi:hypothetical protein
LTRNPQLGQKALRALALFPEAWNCEFLERYYPGIDRPHLADISSNFSDAAIVAGQHITIIYLTSPHKRPLRIRLPGPRPLAHVAWALIENDGNHELEPLVLFSTGALVYVFNVTQAKFVSCIRGHGGVHPLAFPL